MKIPRKKAKKNLQALYDLIRLIGLKDESSKDARVNQFVKKRNELSAQLIDEWLKNPKAAPTAPVSLPWTSVEECVRLIHAVLCEKMQNLTSKLGNAGTSRTETFRLAEFMEILVANPTRQEVKSSMF